MWMPTFSRGKLGFPRNSRGLTLIELLVTMAIVGLLFGVSVVGLRSAFNVDLKKASMRLSSTCRYLRNKAITDHQYLRVVFDFESQSYRIEESSEPFVIATEEKAEEEGPKNFVASESKLLEPVKLPGNVFFKDITVSYLSGKQEKGEVAVYFFPNGYATPSLINLRDEADEDHYSIEVAPLSGKVVVVGEYREFERKEGKE